MRVDTAASLSPSETKAIAFVSFRHRAPLHPAERDGGRNAGPERQAGQDGATLFLVLEQAVWANFVSVHAAILGVLMVGLATFLPGGLHVRFGGLQALAGVSVCVEPGELLGLIGPNGGRARRRSSTPSAAPCAPAGASSSPGARLLA